MKVTQKTVSDLEKAIVGKTVEEAHKTANEQGLRLRIRTLNGQGTMGTCDYVTNRVNIAVDDDIVTGIVGIG